MGATESLNGDSNVCRNTVVSQSECLHGVGLEALLWELYLLSCTTDDGLTS